MKSAAGYVIYQKDGSPSSAVVTPTIIQKQDEAVPEKIPSFLTKFTDILFGLGKKNDRHISSLLINPLANICLGMNLLKGHTKIVQTAKMSPLELGSGS